MQVETYTAAHTIAPIDVHAVRDWSKDPLKDTHINILLVDDRPENLISLAAVLDAPDFNLVSVTSGREALKALLAQDFALILMDVQMPIMDGFETASLIKQREKTRHIPIIFITAVSGDTPFLFKGYDAGAVDYIVKPVDPKILRSKVAVFAELHRKTQQIERQARLIRDHERIEREREIARLELESMRREQSANEKYRDLVDGITSGIVWSGDPLTRKFIFVSPQAERILGTQSFHVFEKQIFDHSVFDGHEHTSNEPKTAHFEHSVIRDDGATVWLQTGIRFSVRDGHPVEVRGLSVDITEIKQAQEQAQSAIRIRDEFLSIASHELKTPLTPLRLHLENLQRMEKNIGRKNLTADFVSSKVMTGVDKACRQVDRLANLVDELLDVSRISSGKFVLEREEFDFGEAVKEIVDRLREEAQKKKTELHCKVIGNAVGNWDRLKIEQVIINLITNAVKYGAGNPVSILVEANPHSTRLQVRDQGIGIDPCDHARIFNLYERAVSPMNFGGLGLGLYIVKQIVTEHQGTITLESEIGKGSTFTVELPIV